MIALGESGISSPASNDWTPALHSSFALGGSTETPAGSTVGNNVQQFGVFQPELLVAILMYWPLFRGPLHPHDHSAFLLY